MTDQARSLLVIAPDPGLAETVGAAAATLDAVRIQTEIGTVSGLNGRAVTLAAGHDLVIFQSDPADPAEIDAVRRIAAEGHGRTTFVALADEHTSLGQIRALTEAGVTQVLPLPAAAEDLGRALAALAPRPAPAAPQPSARGRLFATLQARGGVGATLLAVNLADQFARAASRRQAPQRAALLDLDFQFGSTGNMLDLPEQNTLIDLAFGDRIPDARFLDLAMQVVRPGFSVLAAPSRLGPVDALSARQVEALLDRARERAEKVVVDLPRPMLPWIEPVLKAADAVLLVTDLSVPSIRHCRRLIDFLSADHPGLPIRLVVNREQKPLFGGAAQKEAARALERPLDIWLPNDPRAARAAGDRGQPLSRAASRAPLTRAIRRLARRLEVEFPAAVSAQPNA
ncbi:AAA family ATPase [Solirhodobacter olei]|uniref:AAA family ATPase n=1 Tax=Solirhodobacter olei TaxID=2493082 RepID=UPI000FD8905C|nr:hypothetical protein [Solirhodobacter olei]